MFICCLRSTYCCLFVFSSFSVLFILPFFFFGGPSLYFHVLKSLNRMFPLQGWICFAEAYFWICCPRGYRYLFGESCALKVFSRWTPVRTMHRALPSERISQMCNTLYVFVFLPMTLITNVRKRSSARRSDATRSSISDRWFRTGRRGRFLIHNRLYVVQWME